MRYVYGEKGVFGAMHTTLHLLVVLVTFCIPPASISATDHSAELFLQLGHSRSVNAVAFSPDGKTLASGSADNTIMYWDSKSSEIMVRTVLLPGNQWLAYSPRKLVYNSSYPSTQEEKYAAIRFDGQLRPVYPLQYYRQELKRENGLLAALQAPQPVIQPKRLRLWWDTSK